MPLNTEIERDGKALSVRWGGFHVAAMVLASAIDGDPDGPILTDALRAELLGDDPFKLGQGDVFALMSYPVIGASPLNDGAYTLKKGWSFIDCADGELLELLPGDVLKAWRN